VHLEVVGIGADLVEREGPVHVLDDVVLVVGENQDRNDGGSAVRLLVGVLLARRRRFFFGQLVLRYQEEPPAALSAAAARITDGPQVEVADVLVSGVADDLGNGGSLRSMS